MARWRPSVGWGPCGSFSAADGTGAESARSSASSSLRKSTRCIERCLCERGEGDKGWRGGQWGMPITCDASAQQGHGVKPRDAIILTDHSVL